MKGSSQYGDSFSFPIYNESMEIIIDKIGIWKADYHKGYTVRVMPAGIRYFDKSGICKLANDKINRYAKNYKKGKTEFVLFVRTFSSDKDAIEKQLDKVAKTITEAYAKEICMKATFDEFEYLNEYVKEGE